MAIPIDQTYALATAILKAVAPSIDPGAVRSVRFEHEAGELPVLTVEIPTFNADTRELDIDTQRWVLDTKASV